MKKQDLFLRSEIEYKYRNSEKGFLSLKVKEIFKPSAIKKRGYIPECNKKEVKNHFHEHIKKYGRNCFYCNDPWTYIINRYVPGSKEKKSDKGKKRENIKNFSIDRLDNSKTYSINNIIFCCNECNRDKRSISIKLIKRLYEVITERNL
jgi:5-methylcytosine-specific restriction endonuclease McrA